MEKIINCEVWTGMGETGRERGEGRLQWTFVPSAFPGKRLQHFETQTVSRKKQTKTSNEQNINDT